MFPFAVRSGASPAAALCLTVALAGCDAATSPGAATAPGAATPAALETVAAKPEPAAPPVAPADPTGDGMAAIPGGAFRMGTADPPRLHSDESPPHTVTLSPFWMDETEVTNDQFAAFVAATGYVTAAERPITRADLAGQVSLEFLANMPEEGLPPSSICMSPKFDPYLAAGISENPNLVYAAGIWVAEPGANWRHPRGPGSDIGGKGDHPVVHVTWEDAAAYAAWAGKQLPTEAQWEYAARGGAAGREYPWGDELVPAGAEGAQHRANIYQGRFPFEDSGADGYTATAPVRAFPPNAFGLYALSGNVWEWCRDWYRADYYAAAPPADPPGPASSFDPAEPNVPKRVQRGGSFLCSDNYCTGYRVASRMKGDPGTGSFHCGFRCVVEDVRAWRRAPRWAAGAVDSGSDPNSPAEDDR